jgi:ABC-type bacteriocin/lantibiotic exporter with double-glycine peptidase domain
MENKSTFSLLHNLWTHISMKRRRQLIGLLVFSFFVSLAEIINIGLIFPFLGAFTAPEKVFKIEVLQPIFYKYNILNPAEILFPITILFIIAVVFSGIMRLTMVWLQSRLSYLVGADISISCYRNMLYSPYLTIISRNTSEYITGMVEKNRMIVTQVILPILLIISATIVLIAILITLLLINPLVAISSMLTYAFIYLILLITIKKRLQTNSQTISEKSNKLIQGLQESFGGIRDIIIDGTQDAYCKIFGEIDLSLRRAEASIALIGQTPRFVIESSGMIILALLAHFLSFGEGGIKSAIPILGVFALGAHRLIPTLQQIYQSCTSILGCKLLLVDILFYLNQKLPQHHSSAKFSSIKFDKSISLKNIDFRYSKSGPLILNNFNCVIKKGEIVGFTGTSGSGKSTLIDIVMCLLNPSKGGLLIDNKRINAKNYRSWHLHISHVPQNIFLADLTVSENIAFGVPPAEIDHKLVFQCAKKAQISSTIESWPLKYNTVVGERGIRLSGGQTQRIGIARALYKKTDVISFDEATNALDAKTESHVMRSILNFDPKITILFISHRHATLKYCTKIIELADGKLLRQGTFKEIILNKKNRR